MISKTSLQIIKALLQLTELPQGESLGVGRIASKIDAPENYLGKVLQKLVHSGVVVSQKGLNGGFRLAKDPKDIKLYEIVACLEDLKRWEGCFMGRSECSSLTPCSAHHRWETARAAYMSFLKSTSVDDLRK